MVPTSMSEEEQPSTSHKLKLEKLKVPDLIRERSDADA
jgi:hypothetical protein